MTVAELIERLKEFPQDLSVQFLDCDYGPTDVVVIATDYDSDWARPSRPKPDKPTAVWLSEA